MLPNKCFNSREKSGHPDAVKWPSNENIRKKKKRGHFFVNFLLKAVVYFASDNPPLQKIIKIYTILF
jgi:hypothetical protein